MPQVSKIRVRKEIEDRMFDVLRQVIVGAKNHQQADEVINDLFTSTERVMIAKRLAIAMLLLAEYDYRAIRDILNVSYATIGRISNWLKIESKSLNRTFQKLQDQDAWKSLLKDISQIFIDLNPYPHHSPFQGIRRILEKKTPF